MKEVADHPWSLIESIQCTNIVTSFTRSWAFRKASYSSGCMSTCQTYSPLWIQLYWQFFFFSILFFKLPGCLGKACCGHQDTYPVVIRTAELTQLCFHHTERLFSLCKTASTWYMISCLIHLSFIPANTYNCLHSANSLPWRTSNTERYSSLNQSWLTVLGAFSFNVLCITY